jgi:hypothetical protein
MVKGSVNISLEDYHALLESAAKTAEIKDKFYIAAKELQVFLSFLTTRESLEKYVDEFNKQSKTSQIIFEGTTAKIELKNE